MNKLAIALLLFVFLALIALFARLLAPAKEVNLKTAQINAAVFDLEVSDNFIKRAQGLSNRLYLPENKAMLFIFERPGNYGFWMKNMQFPIDILWVQGNQIIGIDKNISADSADVYYPPRPVEKVLEINAGLADKLEIQVGDAIILK